MSSAGSASTLLARLICQQRPVQTLTSARNSKGNTQSGRFSKGVFQVKQSRKTSLKGRTDLKLTGSSFSSCRSRGSTAQVTASRRRLSRKTIRKLSGSAKGNYRTSGRKSAATVRGTVWTVTDRCDGTLTKVKRGKVSVRDFRRKKTITVRAGKSYLAR